MSMYAGSKSEGERFDMPPLKGVSQCTHAEFQYVHHFPPRMHTYASCKPIKVKLMQFPVTFNSINVSQAQKSPSSISLRVRISFPILLASVHTNLECRTDLGIHTSATSSSSHTSAASHLEYRDLGEKS